VSAPEHRRRWAVVLLFVTPALWSVNYLVARAAADVVAPHMLAFWRWLLAGALLGLLAQRDIRLHREALAREWKQLLVLGALGMWICGAFVYLGGRTTTATNISLIYALSPVLIAVVSTWMLGERLGFVQVLGIGISLVGFFHVVLKGQWANLASVQLTPGDWWILTAAISWAAYTILMKRWPTVFGATARLALVAAAGLVVLLPFTLVEVMFLPSEISWRVAGYVLATALFPAFGAYLSYSFMLRELGASRVGVVLYLGPIYVAAMAWVVLGEPVRPFHYAGAALILPGLYLATRPSRRG
jgi:drug/metabolite transporter (DMT)-like permease